MVKFEFTDDANFWLIAGECKTYAYIQTYKQTWLMYYMSVGLTQTALIRGSTAH